MGSAVIWKHVDLKNQVLVIDVSLFLSNLVELFICHNVLWRIDWAYDQRFEIFVFLIEQHIEIL